MIAVAAALFTACSNEAIVDKTAEKTPDQPFTFSAYANKVTKAGSNSAKLQDFYTVFGVYGYKNVKRNVVEETVSSIQDVDEAVFTNTPNEYFATDEAGSTVYTSGKPSDEWTFSAGWYYENVRYWDKMANSYTFFAIAPYEATPSPALSVEASFDNIKIGSSSAKYDISTEKNLAIAGTPAVPQADLSYSGFNKDYMLAAKNNSRTSDVVLEFHHILAKLNVKILLSDTYKGKQELKINELKIDGLAKQGYFVYNTDFVTKGWTTNDTYARDIAADYSLTAETNYSENYWIETLMFPQVANCKAGGAQPSAADLEDMYIYIKYQIGSEVYEAYYDLAYVFDNTKAPVPAVLYTEEDEDIPEGKEVGDVKEDAIPGGNYEFKQGSEYTLTLTVGPEPIHFDAKVTPWADQDEEENSFVVNQNVD